MSSSTVQHFHKEVSRNPPRCCKCGRAVEVEVQDWMAIAGRVKLIATCPSMNHGAEEVTFGAKEIDGMTFAGFLPAGMSTKERESYLALYGMRVRRF
jgi:hypothetical protein